MMRRNGIRARVLLLALLPLTVLSFALGWYFIVSRLNDMDRALEERGAAMASQLAQACEYGLFSGQPEALLAIARNMQADKTVTAVRVTSRQGVRLVSVGGREVDSLPYSVTRPSLTRARDTLYISAPVRSMPLALDDAGIDQQVPEVIGYVTLGISLEPTRARQRSMLASSVILSVSVLLVAGLMALRLGRDIVNPIGQLTDAVRKIGAGNLNVPIELGAGGEFSELASGIRQMMGDLRNSYDTLQTKVQEATAKLTWQASHDPLTSLANRVVFEQRIEQALLSARQEGRRHCLVFMDLDQFKVVNDTSGHKAGDELLRQLSAQLRQALRNTDLLARLGGDEFGMLFLDCEAEAGLRIAEGLRRVVEAFRFHWVDRVYSVGASLGLAEIHAEWDSVASLLSAADTACYAAKEGGRNRVHQYRETDQDLIRRRGEMEWASRISQAVSEKRLRLYCQYLRPLKEGDASRHYELLLRMVDDADEVILPTVFLPAAERYQLTAMLDTWVVDQVLDHCTPILKTWPDVVFSINISGASLGDSAFQEYLRNRLTRSAQLAANLCFEITETAVIANLDSALTLIEDLRKLGCRFALDDFGSGLSSFAYLRSLPVDYLKIDGAFVRDMDQDPIDAAMVEAIQKVAGLMGVRTVAEFVENERAVEMLKAMGVDYAQGHYFHAPYPLVQLCDVLGVGTGETRNGEVGQPST